MTDMAESPDQRARERGPGAVLAAARAAQSLSVADVARQLKLSASQVAALEAGEYERLPGPVFVRGFVRNYARLLKMDPDRILGMVVDTPAQVPPNQMPTSRGVPFPSSRTVRRSPRLLLLVFLAVVALGVYEFYWRDAIVFVSPSPEPSAPVAIAPAKQEPAPSTVAAPASEASLPVPAASKEETVAAAPPAEPPAEISAAATRTGERELRFVFSRDSWVQVRDGAGKVIFTRLNAAGTEQRVAGTPPFALVIGNAQGVRLSYNERPVDLNPHIVRDDVARFQLE
ncbi:MAG: family transcriptional regulator [Burkholderiales bacterium]|nr:family transcriptional regulator [Burkholderiales bacterium]